MGNIFTAASAASSPINFNQDYVDDDDDDLDAGDEESYKILTEHQISLNGKFNNHSSNLYIVKKLHRNGSFKLNYYTMKLVNTTTTTTNDDNKFQYALNKANKLMLLEKHENIVSYLDSYQEMNKIYFIMDYCYGNTLKERIELQLNKVLHKKSRYFNEIVIWYWFLDMLNGLNYLHRNEIYHSDLKPENIFIDCKNGACKIGNFNLEKFDESYFRMLNVKNYNSLLYKPPEYRFINDYKFNLQDESLLRKLNEVCDVFSLGCILYELVHLERAILNPFLKELVLVHEHEFDDSLANLINSCLEFNYEKRSTTFDLFQLDAVKSHLHSLELKQRFYAAYKEQVIPSIDFKRNYNGDSLKSNYLKVNLELNYKPSAVVGLKYSQNLIIISLNKYLNEADYSFLFASNLDPYIQQQIKSKLVIYSEFGEPIFEFYSYIDDTTKQREYFNFKIYSMCIDETNCFIYLSTDTRGILRLKYMKDFKNKELALDTVVDLKALNKKLNLKNENIIAKCIHLTANATTSDLDRTLLISDNLTNNLISLKFKSTESKLDYHIEWIVPIHDKITTQQQQQQTVFQIFTTNNEIVCLLNDFVTIQVYYLSTGLFKRDNKQKLSLFNIDTIQALCMDSDSNLYSTDGSQFYSINLNTFDLYNICETLEDATAVAGNNTTVAVNRRPLFNSIVFMQILINGKIVLVKDVVQTENSVLFILKPMFKSVDQLE